MSALVTPDQDTTAAPPAPVKTSAVGKPIDRVDGRRKITGAALYAADVRHEGLVYAVLVQSTIAKGEITSIDTAAARRSPGVLTVLRHENAPELKKPKPGAKADPLQSGKTGEDRLPLSDNVIHYAGQHVAVVVAGGFGCKGFQWPHTMLAAMASRVVHRPVQLNLTRAQMFTSVGHRPPTVQKLALAATKDGTLRAIRHETLSPTSPVTEFVEPAGTTTSKLMYACDNVAIPHHLARLNVGSPCPMRAPGDCPGTFALESAMDELAYALGMDPLELRLKNHADEDGSEKKPWSSKHLKEWYQRGAERFGWSRRKAAPGSMKDGDLLVGWGMATAVYLGNRRAASARAVLSSDGRALVQAATQDLGTGSYTIFTQIAADALGLPTRSSTPSAAGASARSASREWRRSPTPSITLRESGCATCRSRRTSCCSRPPRMAQSRGADAKPRSRPGTWVE